MPLTPPTMWVRWDTLSVLVRPSAISLPKYRATTSSMVRGMPPFFISVNEDRTIIMNTTPLAPSRAEWGNSRNCTSPVAKAVMTMVSSRLRLPYFSSSPGPTSSRSSMLLI